MLSFIRVPEDGGSTSLQKVYAHEATSHKGICWKSEKRVFIIVLLLEIFHKQLSSIPPEAYLEAKYYFLQNFNFLFLLGHSN
jgi:hypothetical protein